MKRFVAVFLSVIFTFLFLYPYAEANDVKVVKKGESVPFDGVLFTMEMEKSIRMDIQVYKKSTETLSKINELNEQEIDILGKRLSLYQTKTNELLRKEDNTNLLKNVVFFLSGALIMGVVSYGVSR